MAIDIQPPNYGALAALAGKSAQLNLQSPGALGLQALQQAQANQASLRDDAARQMALQQQGQLGLLANHAQNRALDIQQANQEQQAKMAQAGLNQDQQKMAMQQSQFNAGQNMDQQKLAMQQSQFDAGQSMDQNKLDQTSLSEKDNLDLQNRILAENTAKDQMAKLLADSKQNLQDKGAFASYGLLSMTGAKTPEEAAQIKDEILKEAASKKYMSPEQLKAASQMSISQFTNGLKYNLVQTGTAAEYNAVKDKQSPTTGTNITFNPDGSLATVTSAPTNAEKTAAQKVVNDRSQALMKLKGMMDNFDPNEFTNMAQANNTLSIAAERNKGIPLVGTALDKAAQYTTGQNADERAKNISKFTEDMNNIEQFFNQSYKQPMTGAAVGEQELKDLRKGYLSGDMSESQAKGALNQLVKKFVGEKEYNQVMLNKGVDTSVPGSVPAAAPSLASTVWSPQKNAAMLAHGYSQDAIDKYYGIQK